MKAITISELKELVTKKAVVTQDQVIDTSVDSDEPKLGKKLDNFQVNVEVSDEHNLSVGVPAKTEAEAIEKAIQAFSEMPEQLRGFKITE